MASVLSFPNSARLQQIAQTMMPHLMQDDPLFDYFPIDTQDEDMIIWEQLDNFLGVTQARGLSALPPKVRPTGLARLETPPGAYGEYEPIDEEQLTKRRNIATFNQPVDITDLVLIVQNKLLQRQVDRYRYLLWTLLTTGTFSVTNIAGAVVHTDSYNFQSYTAPVAWATSATAGPLADFSAVQLLSRGFSVDFGSKAIAMMNRQTFNDLRTNTNAGDIYGRRAMGLSTINNQAGINALLLGDDLPQVLVYDRHYRDDNGIVQMWIPYKTVIIFGQRPAGQTIGVFRHTRNFVNPAMAPGPYSLVVDQREHGQVPGQIEVHRGFNGGPVAFYPSAIIKMSV